MNDNKMISIFFILYLAGTVIAYVLDPHNVFPGKVDDILVCISGMIAIRSCYRIGFKMDVDE